MKKKYHLVKWKRVSQLKKTSGLGVKDLGKMNVSLLCKWWWKLEYEQGLWQRIVKKKYLKNSFISLLKKKPKNSPVWNQLISIRDIYTSGRKLIVGNGNSTSFWKDTWLCDTSLQEKFPLLFDISTKQNASVAEIAQQGWRLVFRRWLNEELQVCFRKLTDLLNAFAVNSEADKPRWKWGNNGLFSVKSAYEHLCVNEFGANYNLIWKAKLPLKIKIWL